MERLRDGKGRFKSTGLPPKKRVRTEYNKKYHREVLMVGERHNKRLQGARESWRKHKKARIKNNLDWARNNRERSSAIKKKYSDNNKEKCAEKNRQWQKKNPDKVRYNCHRRRMRLLEAVGLHTIEQWQLLKKLTGNKCVSCKKEETEVKLTIDHIKSLFNKGTDNIDNIQPLCRQCNSSKGIKTINYLDSEIYGKP